MRRLLGVAACFWLIGWGAMQSLAAPATPVGIALPAVAQPEDCVARPDPLVPLLLTPPSLSPTPNAATPLPAEVDSATQRSVLFVVYDYFACWNANDRLSLWNLLTPDYVRQTLFSMAAQQHNSAVTIAEQVQDATPAPSVPAAWITLTRATTFHWTAPGRLQFLLTVNDPTRQPSSQTFPVTMQLVDNQWRIADFGAIQSGQ